MSNYHLTWRSGYHRHPGWAVRRSGANKAARVGLTYRQALRLAHKWANIIYVHSPKTGWIKKRIVVNA